MLLRSMRVGLLATAHECQSTRPTMLGAGPPVRSHRRLPISHPVPPSSPQAADRRPAATLRLVSSVPLQHRPDPVALVTLRGWRAGGRRNSLHRGEASSPPVCSIMSRALMCRPVPPFLRLRSTVCDDGYWMGRLDHKDWLAPNEVLKIFANIRDPSLINSAFKRACGRRDYKPSETLYSLMIDKLACAGRFSDVEELLARARIEKVRLSDEFFYRLVKMYGNVAEHPQKAIDTLLAMPGYNCWPSTKTFNYVLHMLVCKRQYEVVHEVYSSAPRLGVTLDTCSFNILVKGLCQFGKFDVAISLLHEMPKQGCQPNVTTYSTLMHFLCQHGRVDKAFELFERMRKQDIAADTVVYNILISGLCREERVSEAFDLFKSMTSERCHPNSGTYQVLLDGLISSARFLEAKNLVSVMSTEGVRPSFRSYKLLIDGLCSNDCLDDAHLVLKNMVGQGFVPRMGTWTKLLTSLC